MNCCVNVMPLFGLGILYLICATRYINRFGNLAGSLWNSHPKSSNADAIEVAESLNPLNAFIQVLAADDIELDVSDAAIFYHLLIVLIIFPS